MADVKRITREELSSRLNGDEQLTLVEALPAMHFEQAHLPGALNLPHDEVDDLAPRLLTDQNVPVVVYCSNLACKNSTIASRRLVELGYTNVFEYEEGKQDWIEAGLPVETGPASRVA